MTDALAELDVHKDPLVALCYETEPPIEWLEDSTFGPAAIKTKGVPLRTAVGLQVRVQVSDAAIEGALARLPDGPRGWLAGVQYQPRVIVQAWLDAVEKLVDEGWLAPGLARKAASLDTVTRAVCVCLSESQGYSKAQNENWVNGVLDSTDRGPWQHNDKYGAYDPKTGKPITPEDCWDLARSTYFAVRVWAEATVPGTDGQQKGSFRKWVGFTSGVYLYDAYWRRGCVAICNLMSFKLDQERVANGYATGVYMPQLVDNRRVRLKPNGKDVGYVQNH